jgi:hypothetical protein
VLSVKQALLRALKDLDSLNVSYAVIGGLAVSARIEPRMTRDVDFAVSVNDDSGAEEILFKLQQLGYVVDSVIEQTAAERLATARLVRQDGGGVILDLLFSSSGIEPEVVLASQEIELFGGTRTAIATVGHLLALKALSESDSRPQDTIDLVALSKAAQHTDWDAAFTAAALITDRGYNRGRDLPARLLKLREQATTQAPD